MTDETGERSPSLIPEAWGEVVSGYESTAEPLTGLFVDTLLDSAGPCEGRRLLDVCTGTGIVALAAARRGARVTAVDFSEKMVDRASHRLRQAGFREATCLVSDVESLGVDDDSFEAAVSNFGVMFAPRPRRAFSELTRVLESGGRLSLTTWTAPKRQGFFRVVVGAMRRTLPDFSPEGPPIWKQFQDPQVLVDYLEKAGFHTADVDTKNRKWKLPSVEWLVQGIDTLAPPISHLIGSLDDDNRDQFKDNLRAVLEEHREDGAVSLEVEAHVATATAP